MIGIYVSYPFCAQKCTFCNFASGVRPRELQDRYFEALLREIQAACFTGQPDTLYLGGGTPSTMEPDQLKAILSRIPGKPWREATIEAAPGTITPERLALWKDSGIDRVSLGVQSFITTELRRTGRKHTAEVVASDIELLRSAGLTNINVDLIAGLPGQTAASWDESLAWIETLRPPHVSVYMLEVDADSRLGQEMLLGGVRYGAADVPGEDLTAEFYETAVARLAAMGIERYEISNFARPGFESVHNLKYWQRRTLSRVRRRRPFVPARAPLAECGDSGGIRAPVAACPNRRDDGQRERREVSGGSAPDGRRYHRCDGSGAAWRHHPAFHGRRSAGTRRRSLATDGARRDGFQRRDPGIPGRMKQAA